MQCKRNIFFFLSLIWVFQSCQNTSEHIDLASSQAIDSTSKDPATILKPFLNSIPAPVEYISSIHNSGIPYQANSIHDPSVYENYLTNHKKALNIGVYGADLCYLSLYKKDKAMSPYFEAIRSLMVDLRVDHVVSFDKYKRFVQNPNDSILNLLSMDLEQINLVLSKRNQSNLCWLVAFGGWIESLYFSANAQSSNQNELHEKLAEQKIVFDEFISMMDAYKNEPGFAELADQIQSLSLLFEQVRVDYQTSDQTSSHEENGVLVVQDASTSTFEISQKTSMELQQEIRKIRSYIIR